MIPKKQGTALWIGPFPSLIHLLVEFTCLLVTSHANGWGDTHVNVVQRIEVH